MKATTFFVILLACTITLCHGFGNIPADFKIYDYVIIGGGGAGSAMANRLSADPSKSVLVIHYGQNDACPACDEGTTMASMGQGLFTASGHDYFSTPNLFTSRSVREIRSGLPGGGTRYYGGVSIPSAKEIFNKEWPAGFDYNTVRPYINKWQDHYCHYFPANVTGISPSDCATYHGQKGGPMTLSPPPQGERDWTGITLDFLNAAPQSGVNVVQDVFNPAYQHGDYVFPITRFHNRANPNDINSERTRESTWTGYLPANLRNSRRNLQYAWNAEARELVYADDLALRLDILLRLGVNLFSTDRRPNAVGVAYLQDDVIKVAFAKKQIVLSAGVEGSPKFLQHNGIGPADLLTSHGIKVVANNPAVGQNLAAHQAVAIDFQTKMPVPVSTNSNGVILSMLLSSPLSKGWADIEVELGLGTFVRSVDPGLTAFEDVYFVTPPSEEGYFPFVSAIVEVVNPDFRGSVNITGPKFSSPSQVEYGWPKDVTGYASSIDYQKMAWGFSRVREILTGNNTFAQKWIQGEISPGASTTLPQDFADLLYSAKYQHSIYHVTGSVSLGKATDLNGRVKGIRGVTVCDNSLIPFPPNANPTNTLLTLCEMIAEKVLSY